MEGKRWFSLLLRVLVLVGISMDLLREAPASSSNILKSSSARIPVNPQGEEERDGNKSREYKGIPLKANLSVCHASFSDAGRPVNCCPAWKDADQTLLDFEFPDPSSPVRIRRPAHLVDEEYVAKYERAVAIMKQIPPDHPHNFWRQSNMHCIYCTGAYDQVNSSAFFKIHRSWLFFPWHRAFIYFHELILGKILGDDSFALPYWSWDTPEGMWFPDIYRKGALNDTERDAIHLHEIAVDDFDRVDHDLASDVQIASNLAFMYHQMISGAKKPELFMGCKLRSGVEGWCNGPGTIEAAPHNTLHSWVGNRYNPERENMGAFYSAARDEVFFAHHSNIDRMWTVWKKMHGDKPEFVDQEWLESEFTFYDENVRLRRIKVRDVLNIDKLRYRYEDIDMPWLAARPKPSVHPKIARDILKKRNGEGVLRMPGETDRSQLSEDGSWTLDKTITVRVGRPRINRTRQEKEEEEEILLVYGIDTKRSRFVKFDVFINVVDETVLSPKSREFAGTFVNLHHVSRTKSHEDGGVGSKMKSHLKLGISELLEDLEADEDDSIWVTLVPRGGTGVNTTVDGVLIDYMK